VSAGTGVITTVAGHYGAYPVPGNGDGGPATAAYLYNPTALVFDKAGNLYIAQSSYNAVRVISATTGIITTFAGGASGLKPVPTTAMAARPRKHCCIIPYLWHSTQRAICTSG